MVDNLKENLHDVGSVPYRIGWFQDNDGFNEGNFQWQDIPLNAELAFGSARGRSGFSSPFVLAHNNVYGGYFLAHLAWSSNWRMSFQWTMAGIPGRAGSSSLCGRCRLRLCGYLRLERRSTCLKSISGLTTTVSTMSYNAGTDT